MAISRRDKERAESGADLAVEPCSLMSRFDALWEFITAATFADGSSRQLPTLTLFVEHRMLKACLNDRAEGMVAFATGTSLTALLEALDEGLQSDTLDWRKTQSGRGKSK